MLVLSRKQGEEIVVGSELVKIYVVEIRDNSVRIGVEAPKDVPVHRREVFEAIKRDEGAA